MNVNLLWNLRESLFNCVNWNLCVWNGSFFLCEFWNVSLDDKFVNID